MESSALLRGENRSTAERYAVGAFNAVVALVLRKALSPILGEQALETQLRVESAKA